MTLHWGIATLESFFIGYAAILLYILHWGAHLSWSRVFFRWPLCRGIFLSVDDGFLSHGYPLEEIRRFFFSHWSMRHDWYIPSGLLYTGTYFSVDDGFWGIVVPWRWLDSFHIKVQDMTGWFPWCDYRSMAFSSLLTNFWDDWIRTQTFCDSMQRSLVISKIALYWGMTLSLAINLGDTCLHLGMIMSERIFVEAYHFVWFYSHWDTLFL